MLITHPDYMVFNGRKRAVDEYPVEYYRNFLEYVKTTYEGQYWQALPRDVARYVRGLQMDKTANIPLGHEEK